MSVRRHAASFGALVLGDAAAKVLGLFAFATLGRRLGADQGGAYGALEAALAAVFIASLCVEGGLAPFGARLVAADPASAPRLLARIASLRLVYATLAAAGLGVYVLVAAPPPNVAALVGWYALTLPPYALYLEWLFQGRGETWWATPPQIGRNLALWLVAAFVVEGPADAHWAPLADAAGFLAGALVQQAVARRTVGGPDFTPPLDLGALSRASFPTLLSGLAFVFRLNYPMVLAGDRADPVVADAYGAAHRLFLSVHAAVPLFCISLLPTWARAHAARDRRGFLRSTGGAVLLFLVAAGVAVAFAASSAPGAVLDVVYAGRFAGGADALAVLTLALGLLGLSAVPRFAFIAVGRPRRDFFANACGAAVTALVAVADPPWAGASPASFARLVLAGEGAAFVAAWLSSGPLWRRAAAPVAHE
jgi:O-antigen/teichoic acid export membrane protein